MKVCHIMRMYSNNDYIKEYIRFVNTNFNSNDHMFLIMKANDIPKLKLDIFEAKNVILINENYREIKQYKNHFQQSTILLIHNLFSKEFNKFLFFNRKYIKKSNWIIWGSDLYFYKYRIHTIKSNIYELVRKNIIKNVSSITSLIKGDYELAQTVYNAKAKYNYAFYPNPVNFKFLDQAQSMKYNNNNVFIIQIGNSADPTNEHKEVLDELSVYRNENIKIVCPLSYGNKEYANKVMEYGNKLFGNKFQPLTEYLPPMEYSKILANIDVAIFNHQRQQALGNIIGLLYLGKKVYIRSDITPWPYFHDIGIKIYDSIDLKNENFNTLVDFDEKIQLNNKKIITKEFSEDHCIELWAKVFEENKKQE